MRLVLAPLIVTGAACAAEPTLSERSAPPTWYTTEYARVMTNMVRAQTAAEEHLAAARAAHNLREEAYALLVLGASLGRQNDPGTGSRHTGAGLEIARRLREPSLLLAARSAHARVLVAADDIPTAIELYLENLHEAERLGDSPTERTSLNGLAVCYSAFGDTDRTLDFGRRALAAAELAKDSDMVAESAVILAEAFVERRDYAGARPCYTRALEIRREAGRKTPLADVEEGIAMLDFHEGRPTDALAALDQVETQRRTLRGRVKLIHVLLHRAEVLTSLKRLDEAIANVEEARGFADVVNTPGLIAMVYHRLSEVRAARGEFALALTAARHSFEADLTVSSEAARQRSAVLQTRYDVAKKDEELARLTRDNALKDAEAKIRTAGLDRNAAELRAAAAELSRSRLQWLALASGIAATACLLGGIVYTQRTRLRVERHELAETRRAQAVAEDANALKTRLLGIASHDLKAPLRTMLLRAGQLEPAIADPASTAALGHLRRDGERMLGIVHDLLDVSAIEAGELRLTFTDLDLRAVADDVVRAQLAHAQQKNLTLAFHAPTPVPVRGDSGRLQQVIANLVDNALKFSPSGKRVDVTVSATPTDARVAVRDDGPGLAAADLAKMFQPFQPLSAVPTGGESSSGLGLHIARELAARHGGRIDVDSAPGAGATFTVVLPLAT